MDGTYPDGHHPTVKGHGLIADLLFAFLQERLRAFSQPADAQTLSLGPDTIPGSSEVRPVPRTLASC